MQLSPFVIAAIVGVIGLVIIILVVVLRKKSGSTTDTKPKKVGILKAGNNGSVSCQDYCRGPWTDVKYKDAVSATLQRTNENVDITYVPGAAIIPGSNPPNYGQNALTCMCTND